MRLGIQNFQGVREYQEIDIAPITLIYGQNSAGKSSIYDAISVLGGLKKRGAAAMRFSWLHTSETNAPRVSEGEETIIRLDGLSWVSDDFYYDDLFEWMPTIAGDSRYQGVISELFALLEYSPSTVFSCEYRWRGLNEDACFSGYRLNIDGIRVIDVFVDRNGSKRTVIYCDHSFIKTSIKYIEASSALEIFYEGDIEKTISLNFGGLFYDDIFDSNSELFDCLLFGEVSREDQLLLLIGVLTHGVLVRVSNWANFTHVAATRSTDPNELVKSNVQEEGLYDKLKSLLKVLHLGNGSDVDIKLLEMLNRWLCSSDFLDSGFKIGAKNFRVMLSIDLLLDDENKKISSVLEAESFFERVECDINLIDVFRNREVSFCDVGVGISQVVPVLLALLPDDLRTSPAANGRQEVVLSRFRGGVYVEQPELHLHPRMQAVLGDVALEAMHESRHILMETHSELLVLRLLRRIRETTNGVALEKQRQLIPSQLSVVYAHRKRSGSTEFRQLRVGPDGDFLDKWPDGFFAERDVEIFY